MRKRVVNAFTDVVKAAMSVRSLEVCRELRVICCTADFMEKMPVGRTRKSPCFCKITACTHSVCLCTVQAVCVCVFVPGSVRVSLCDRTGSEMKGSGECGTENASVCVGREGRVFIWMEEDIF